MTSYNILHLQTLIKMKHRKEWDRRKVMSAATKITSTITGMPRGTDNHSKVEDGAIRIAQIDEVLKAIDNDVNETWKNIEPVISKYEQDTKGDAFKERNAQIFRSRYQDTFTIEEIADNMALSSRRVKQIIKEMERVLLTY